MLSINPITRVKPLTNGAAVSAVATSSYVVDDKPILESLEILKSWGLKPLPYKRKDRHWGYLASDDATRYAELHPRKPVDLIAFERGGWGAARLLERPQKWKPGWMLGFSDVTSILLSRLSAGFDGCIHGPLLSSLATEPGWSQERLRKVLFGEKIPDIGGETWCNGEVKGPLIVANLTVASHLLGSKHIPDLNGAILVLEDVGEAPYRIDRMLTQWRLAGALHKIAGLAFGNFKDCETEEVEGPDKSFTIKDILKERSSDLDIPVLAGLPIGHCYGNAALPLGRIAKLDGTKGILSIPSS